MQAEEASQKKGLILKIAIVWLCILLLAGFLLSFQSATKPVTMSVVPEVPRSGEPVVLTFNLNNPSDGISTTGYRLYVNGELIQGGTASLNPGDTAAYQYSYRNPLERGEQISFILKTASAEGESSRMVSLPAYPPQLMSSFVSFAAFSTSVMSSMITAEYFESAFGTDSGINTGIIVAGVLIALLIFLELTQAVIAREKKRRVLTSYRLAFSTMSAVLFIIVISIVFTRVVMIVTL